MRKRATAVIIRNEEVLLIRRTKAGREYYIFPGGGVEEGETIEDAVKREVKEETTIEVDSMHKLFFLKVGIPQLDVSKEKYEHEEHVYFVEKYSGSPELSGPEKERASEQNQYHLEWKPVSELDNMVTLYPREVAKMVVPFLK